MDAWIDGWMVVRMQECDVAAASVAGDHVGVNDGDDNDNDNEDDD